MNDISEELSAEESARCRAALLPEEQVLLIARPRTQLGVLETLFRVIPGVVMACSLSYALCMMSAIWWLALLITLPAWGVVIALLCSPYLHRRRRERTVYLLTDKRVMVLDPGVLFGARVVAYPLQPDPVREIRRGDDGFGDIVFGYEQRWQLGARIHRGPSPVGFIEVPEVDSLAAVIAEQVAATPPSAPLPAAQLPSFAGMPTATDSWGNPQPMNTGRVPLIALGSLFSAASLLFLVLGIVMLCRDARFEREAVRTTATVVSVRKEFHETEHHSSRHHRRSHTGVRIRVEVNKEKQGNWLYYPSYQFADAEGTLHQFESNVGSTKYNFPIGHAVEVAYLPSAPDDARLCDDGPSLGLIFALVGGMVLVVGGGLLAGGLMMKK